MHTRMSWWTEESIDWFVRASVRTDYHRILTENIAALLKDCGSIMELGCGLGYEAELLSSMGFCVKAYDKDQNVISKAIERSSLNIFQQADAKDIDGLYDAVLCINYGHLEEMGQLNDLLAHASKRLVYIISRHSGHGADTREDRTDKVRKLLEKASMSFEERGLVLSFDQPLLSMEEARTFIEWTYLGKNAERYLRFVERSDDADYPLVFRNRKEMVLFSVEKEERK